MDRRYSEMRFYDGARAARGPQDAKDDLVRRSLGRARQVLRSAETYGGSTGGASSIGGIAPTSFRGASYREAKGRFEGHVKNLGAAGESRRARTLESETEWPG